MEKKRLLILLLVLCLPVSIFAETVVLKSGKTVEGKIIEKTDKYVKIDFQGVPITYFVDEIEKVVSDNSPITNEKKDKVNLVIVGDAALTYASYFFELSPDWYPDMDQYMLIMVQQKGFWRAKHKNGKAYILVAPTKIRSGDTADNFIGLSKELMQSKGASVKNYDFKPNLSYPCEVYFEYLPELNRYGLIVFAKLPEHVIHFALYTMGEDSLSSYLEEFNSVLASFKWTLGLSDEEIGKMLNVNEVKQSLPLVKEKKISQVNNPSSLSTKTAKQHLQSGIAYADQNNLTQAILECSKAIEINPNYAEAYVNRGVIYQNQRNFTQAISDFTKAIETGSNKAETYNYRGMTYQGQGNFTQAISDFSKAIEIDSSLVDTYNNRAVAYYRIKEYDKAWVDVHKAEASGFTPHPGFLDALKKASGRDK